jgi:hypothetical protein
VRWFKKDFWLEIQKKGVRLVLLSFSILEIHFNSYFCLR